MIRIDFESKDKIIQILERAQELKLKKNWADLSDYSLMTLFDEPSTRTKVSFQMACAKLKTQNIDVNLDEKSSRSKGETLQDSLRALALYEPDILVARASLDQEWESTLNQKTPKYFKSVINAGYGSVSHPTQALLDYLSLMEQGLGLKSFKLLMIGDVLKSRVFQSHLGLAKMMGYEIKTFSPELGETQDIENFKTLEEAIKWADVLYKLRTQKERGTQGAEVTLNVSHLAQKKGVYLMHPGPFLPGLDFVSGLEDHPQSLIWDQMNNGLYLRAALIELSVRSYG